MTPKFKPVASLGGPTAAEKTWIPILADWKNSGLGNGAFYRQTLLQRESRTGRPLSGRV
jgi:hypothetical protein